MMLNLTAHQESLLERAVAALEKIADETEQVAVELAAFNVREESNHGDSNLSS